MRLIEPSALGAIRQAHVDLHQAPMTELRLDEEAMKSLFEDERYIPMMDVDVEKRSVRMWGLEIKQHDEQLCALVDHKGQMTKFSIDADQPAA